MSNFWDKDLLTTRKTALAENQQIRLFSLETGPGTVPVCFNLVFFCLEAPSSLLRFGECSENTGNIIALRLLPQIAF